MITVWNCHIQFHQDSLVYLFVITIILLDFLFSDKEIKLCTQTATWVRSELNFSSKSVFGTLTCDNSNESYWAVFSSYVQVVVGFKNVDKPPVCDRSNKCKANESSFHVLGALFIIPYQVVLTWESVQWSPSIWLLLNWAIEQYTFHLVLFIFQYFEKGNLRFFSFQSSV